MPFTFVHPTAAIPLYRPLKRLGCFSALVVGSLTPDFAYFLPLSITGTFSHSFLGLILFCLPIGLASYLIFHGLIKKPILSLLPRSIAGHIPSDGFAMSTIPPVPWAAVLVSLAGGTATHIVWDSFTHRDSPVVEAIPLLNSSLFAIYGYQVHLYTLLQHLSTLAGFALLVLWVRQWLHNSQESEVQHPVDFSPLSRLLIASILVVIPCLLATLFVFPNSWPLTFSEWQALFVKQIFSSISFFGAGILLYSLAWQFCVRRNRNT